MAPSLPDAAETGRLLDAVRAGDRGALDRLMEHHRAYLRGVVGLRLDPKLRARADASDVVQEAQIEAVRRVGDYVASPALPFHLWLRQIAYDRLLMLRRRHVEAARRAVACEAGLPDESSLRLAEFVMAGGPSPSQEMARGEMVADIHRALTDLDDDDREILLMRTLEGLSNQEVAQVLNLDPATASKRYGRSLLRLRKLLATKGVSESAS